MKGITLFSSAGIGELFLSDIGIDIKVANELIEKRGNLYKEVHQYTDMVIGDITDEKVFNEIIDSAGNDVDILFASPPCQGMSIAGKNRCADTMSIDERNYLINYVIKAIHLLKPKYVLIENVPSLLRLVLKHNEDLLTVPDILKQEFGEKYIIESDILDAANYGIPQTRKRAIIRMYLKDKVWKLPEIENEITLKDAIGHLPSLESEEISDIKWHYARKHDSRHVSWMKHTSTGQTAFLNEKHYPKKANGDKIKGYESSYRRMRWDIPAATITMRNDAISSQRNVHPGRKKKDGTYSDARVLTPHELMIVNSMPTDWNIPDTTPEVLIRQCIGESIPPLMLKKIVEGVLVND